MDDQFPNIPWARSGSPATAFDAAESMVEAARNREIAALAWVRSQCAYGSTVDEGAAALSWPERYSARPRFSMLRSRGEIVDSGQRRKGVSGRQQAVWVAPEFAPGCPAPEMEGGDRG